MQSHGSMNSLDTTVVLVPGFRAIREHAFLPFAFEAELQELDASLLPSVDELLILLEFVPKTIKLS